MYLLGCPYISQIELTLALLYDNREQKKNKRKKKHKINKETCLKIIHVHKLKLLPYINNRKKCKSTIIIIVTVLDEFNESQKIC